MISFVFAHISFAYAVVNFFACHISYYSVYLESIPYRVEKQALVIRRKSLSCQ